jgi:serine protease Do
MHHVIRPRFLKDFSSHELEPIPSDFSVLSKIHLSRGQKTMNRITRYRTWIVALAMLSIGSIAGGAFVGGSAMLAGHAPAAAVAAAPSVREPVTMPTTFAPVVKSVLPAVVNISSTKIVKTSAFDQDENPFGNLIPGFRMPNRPQRQEGEGSGVIVSADGYIVTNNHVVDGATEVTIQTSDKRELKARVIGTDPKTDVALVKVNATNLPYAHLGNSSEVEVGDIALAIGNPFGLGQTVTMGIISATGRGGLGIEDYEDFIQTDASINPGNSGGALVNTKGEVIGINTAILSRSGGNQGVGFAIPVDMVRQIMTQLKDKGTVTRARLGVAIQELTPQLASALGVKTSHGAVVGEVAADSPAAKAGLRKEDVIIAMNGKEVDARSLRNTVGAMMPGSRVDLKVLRGSSEEHFSVTLDAMPKDNQRADQTEPAPRLRRRG